MAHRHPAPLAASSPASPLGRRDLLRLLAALGVGGPMLSACGGFSTSGGGGGGAEGALTFLSTQFTPVEEAERFRTILADAYDGSVNYVTGDAGQMSSQVRSQVQAGDVRINVLGGLHGDLAPLANGQLEDLSDLAEELSGAGYSPDFLDLAKVGTDSTWYIPWAQATYVVAVNKAALEHLPSGVDVNDMTYDQFLDWAVAGRQATGQAIFGLPGGPKGLLHRFLQGYIYPSFTGGQITTFRSADAVTAWEYLRELWANSTTASANFDFMQEPLVAGQVLVAWDHVARLVNAPADAPDDWVMVPAPKGPQGRGYMPILTGLAIPAGAPEQEAARELITALAEPEIQIEVLRQNAFFPTVEAEIPDDLPPAIQLEAEAVRRQQESPDSIVALPPVGLGQADAEMTKVFRDSFTAIVLQNQDIRGTLDAQATVLQGLLDQAQAPCWAPDDPGSGDVCRVG